MVEHGTDEGWELGILFAFASLWINGCLGVWVFATGVGQLSLIATAEILEQCAGFFQNVVVGDFTNTAFEELLFGWSVGLGGLQDLGSTAACLLPSSLIGEFGSLSRGFLPVTRVLDSIGFLLAFMNDATVDAVFLLAINNVAALAERAINVLCGHKAIKQTF